MTEYRILEDGMQVGYVDTDRSVAEYVGDDAVVHAHIELINSGIPPTETTDTDELYLVGNALKSHVNDILERRNVTFEILDKHDGNDATGATIDG